MSILDETKKAMEESIERFKKELSGVRTGRANAALLDSVSVDVYGTKMRLKDLATISVPESRQLLITPFDVSNKDAIRAGVEKANLGVTPFVDGNAVRINIPPLDSKVRADLVKVCHQKREDAKVGIRNTRRDKLKDLKASALPEDAAKKAEKSIQELTDKYCKTIDELTATKEKELTAI